MLASSERETERGTTMGMSVGSSSSDEPEVMVDMNTTPLIDVMLVLLIMLIITIPIQLHAVNLDMPTGNPPPKTTEPEIVKIDIDEKSQIFWNGVLVVDRNALENLMIEAAAKPVQPEVHFRPNKLAKYDTVAQVLVSSQRRGLTKLGIVGGEQFLE
jgi:biopolymer transport protein ExbD